MDYDYGAIAAAVYDAFNRGATDELDQLFAPGYIEHEEIAGLDVSGVEAPKTFVRMLHQGFPDMHMELLDVLGQSNRACAWYRLTGTNSGEFAGMPPTGRRIDVLGFDYVNLDEQGRVTEHWGVSQELQMMTQLGVIPEQGATIDLTDKEQARTRL